MIFFPYRVDMELHRIPLLTIAVCILCITVFLQQLTSYADYQRSVSSFCKSIDRPTLVVLRNITGQHSGSPCEDVYLSIRESKDASATMQALVDQARPLNLFKSRQAELDYMLNHLQKGYAEFDKMVPTNLTEELQFNPMELQIKRMVTAVFSHGDWGHLIFNLVFFYAFAASVEIIVGSFSFIFIILGMSISTGLAYSFSVAGTTEAALPTLGLSGIVMGMMALLAVLAPKIKIRCFFWFLLLVRFFSLPALILATWYVGWDIYSLITVGGAGVNFVAHVSGALSGVLIGLIYWLMRPSYIRQINVHT